MASEAHLQALRMVFARLDTQSLCRSMEVCRAWRTLAQDPSLWKVLSLQGRQHGRELLTHALSLARFSGVEELNLEFAQDIDDQLLALLANCPRLLRLNLNACQQVTDAGVDTAAASCPLLTSFSAYWNLRISDQAVASLAAHCKDIRHLNFSGCKLLTDESLELIARTYLSLSTLDITRCVRVTDHGVSQVLSSCRQLTELRLYALSNLSDASFLGCPPPASLAVVDLTGLQGAHDFGLPPFHPPSSPFVPLRVRLWCAPAVQRLQRLSDAGLAALARGGSLREIVLTWCIQLTDAGVSSLAQHGNALELLSLHGIRGVTDGCLQALAVTCRESLATLDVNGCVGIKERSRDALLRMFPNLSTFVVHK